MKRHLFFIFCISLLLHTLGSQAQKFNRDSVLNALNVMQKDSQLLKALSSIALSYFYDGIYDSATYYAAEVLRADFPDINEKACQRQKARASRTLGMINSDQGNPEAAYRYYWQAINLSKKINDPNGLASGYSELGIYYKNTGKLDSAIYYYSESAAMKEEVKGTAGVANAYGNLARVYWMRGNTDTALLLFKRVLNMHEVLGDSLKIALDYGNISGIYQEMGLYKESLDALLFSMRIFEQLHNQLNLTKTLSRLSNLYVAIGDTAQAIEYSLSAIRLADSLSLKYELALAYGNLGAIFVATGNFKTAVEYLKKGYEVASSINDPATVSAAGINLGGAYLNLADSTGKTSDYEKAINYISDAIAMKNKTGEMQGIALAYYNIGMVYTKLHNYNDALQALSAGEQLAMKTGNREDQKTIYDGFTKFYVAKGDYRNAFSYFNRFVQLKDSILNAESKKALSEIQTRYETEKKDAQINLLNKDMALADANAKKQVILRNSLIGGVILFLALTGLWFYRFREKRKALQLLQQTQSQLVQSEKMASLGQLTAGVAHEINNPINFVAANIKPLKRNVDDLLMLIDQYESTITAKQLNEEFKNVEAFRNSNDIEASVAEIDQLIKGIETGAIRTAEVVKGLRNFSRLDENALKKADLNEGIESTIVLLQNRLSQQNIEVINSLGNIPEIECYPGQINQVFMNVITNAIDAVGSNGKIFITTSSKENNLKISIRDTGKGMTEEVKQHIFEPFFTTKDVGKGTGLGLSISYGIIEKHHGKIEVKSEPGKGTEFIITLPIIFSAPLSPYL